VTADGSGPAPAQRELSPEYVSVSPSAYTVPAGVVPDLPKGVTVNYEDAVAGAFSVTKAAEWDAFDAALVQEPGSFTVLGSIEGVPGVAAATVTVVDAREKGDISTNDFSGDPIIPTISLDSMYRWSDVPEGHALRDGALAFSSFAQANPNAMLQDNASSWVNTYYGAGNSYQLSTVFTEAVPYSYVEFYWDKQRAFDSIDLTFLITDPSAYSAGTDVPAGFRVQYWDGIEWQDVGNQSVDAPAEGASRVVTLGFDAVYSDRVRVGMESAAPYTETGGIRIQRAIVTGWTMADAAASPLFPDGGTVTALHEAGAAGRLEIDLNDGWAFAWATPYTTFPADVTSTTARRRYLVNHGLPDPEGFATADLIQPSYDDSGWRTVHIPHDYAIEGDRTTGVAGSVGALNSGIGWYRKSFTAPEAIKANGERVLLEFEGVYHNSYVWLNGELVGNYYNGYTGFAFDITDEIIYGGAENVLAVKVNSASPSGRWYHGGGIIRPVNVIVSGPLSFDRHGVVLTSPDLEAEYKAGGQATLGVRGDFSGKGGAYDAYMETTVYDASGAQVARARTAAAAVGGAGAQEPLSQELAIPGVQLWYPWNLSKAGGPYLYTVRTELYAKPQGAADAQYALHDAVEQDYGFRWAWLQETDLSDPSKGGFYINDEYTKFYGVNIHSDTGALGAVSNKDAYERQVELLMGMGVNLIRTAHNPVAKEFVAVCNEKGVMVIEEAHDSWGEARATYDFGAFFWDVVPADWPGLAPNGYDGAALTGRLGVQYPGVQYTWGTWVVQEMVRRDINEPSVIIWDMGNEVRQDALGGGYTQAEVDADDGTGNRALPGYDVERGVVGWYDGTKYDDEAVTGLPTNTRNDGYDAYTIGNKDIPGVQIDLYTEGVRLSEDAKAIDRSRFVMQTSDNMRWPRADDPDDDWTYQYTGGDTSVYGRWGYISRYQGIMGLQYSTNDSNDVLYDRFSGDSFVAFFESETNAAGANRGLNFAPRSVFAGLSFVPGWSGYSGYMNGMGAYWSGVPIISIKRDRDRKYFLGSTLWAGMDYLGEGGGKGSNSGAINTAGFFKDYYYMQKASWMSPDAEKFVYLMPINWNDHVPGEPIDVRVYSNVQSAELFLNGRSLGVKSFDVKETNYGMRYLETSNTTRDDTSRSYWKEPLDPDPNPGGYISPAGAKVVEASGDSEIAEGALYGDPYLTWEDVPYEPGTLEIKAYDSPAAYAEDKEANVVATDKAVTAEVPYAIKMRAYKDKLVMAADGESLVYVECDVVDEAGNTVADGKNLIKFSVSGAAVIAGADAGENNSYSLTSKWGNVQFNTESQYYADTGKALVILQSVSGLTGPVRLVASSDGLMPAVLDLSVTADGSGPAPAQYEMSPVYVSVSPSAFTVPAGVAPSLPRGVTVNYVDAVAGAFSVTKAAEWDAFDEALLSKAGSFTVSGDVEGVPGKAVATVTVVDAREKGDISTNDFSGAQIIPTIALTSMYRWSDIPEGHALRDGALAFSSFATGNPNAMLQANTTNWQNTYSSTGNSYQLSTRFVDTVPYSYVEFYWDKQRAFDKIDLTFLVTAPTATAAGTDVPAGFRVQYWDGIEWQDVKNQSVDAPAEGASRVVTLGFDAVYADRVRVGMENGTPYTNTGGMRIQRAIVTGWTMSETKDISSDPGFGVYVVQKPEAGSGAYDPAFRIANLGGAEASVSVLAVAYGANGRLLRTAASEAKVAANAEAVVQVSLPLGEGVAYCKFYVWKDGAVPITGVTSLA
jgi:hypothetical protein